MENKRSVPVKLYETRNLFVEKIETKHGETISWEAHDSDVSIFVPDANEIFNSKERVFDITKGGTVELKVMHKPEPGQQKRYHYAVYHKDLKDFGIGNSSPVIIIQG